MPLFGDDQDQQGSHPGPIWNPSFDSSKVCVPFLQLIQFLMRNTRTHSILVHAERDWFHFCEIQLSNVVEKL